MFRSIFALIAGVVCTTLAVVALDFVLMVAFGKEGPGGGGLLVLLGSYAACSALGGFVTALVAGRSEVRHSLSLGLVFLTIGLASTAFFLLVPQAVPAAEAGAAAQQLPPWFAVVSLAQVVPATVLGGCLRVWQRLLWPGRSA
jgi:hypothetical protein